MDEFEALEEEFAEAADQPVEPQDLQSEEVTEETVAEEAQETTEEAVVEPETPVEPVVEEAQSEEVETPPVEAKTYTVPNDPSFGEHAGKKFTAVELDSLGLLEKINTREHQELHNTKLYQELKAKTDAAEAAVAAQQVQTQQQMQFTPEQITKNAGDTLHVYEPHLRELAKAGAFEEDFLSAYPKVATQLEQRFDAGTGALMLMSERIQQLEGVVGKREQGVQRTENQNTVMQSINQVVSDDEGTYGVLADEVARNNFIGWIVNPSNPLPFRKMPVAEMTPEVIKAAFLSYVQSNPDIVPARVAAPVVQGSGTTGTKAPRQMTELEAMEAEFNTMAENRFGG